MGSPHLSSEAKFETGQGPCGIHRKNSSNLFSESPRLGEWGCFGTSLGAWTRLSLSLTRLSTDQLQVGMTMNGITYKVEDTIDPSDPTAIKQIDAIAIGYPNGRDY